MFLLTEISPTVIFMVNTRTKPTEEQLFDYENASAKSFEMNDLNGDVGKSYLDHLNKK